MNKAFTLVELLVTVGIIGILAAVAIASYTHYKDQVYVSQIRVGSHDLYVAGEALITDLDRSLFYSRYYTHSLWHTSNFLNTQENNLLGNQVVTDLVPDLVGDNDIRIFLNLREDLTGEWLIHAAVASCKTSPGVTNYVSTRKHKVFGGSSIVDMSTENSYTNWGRGGTYCP